MAPVASLGREGALGESAAPASSRPTPSPSLPGRGGICGTYLSPLPGREGAGVGRYGERVAPASELSTPFQGARAGFRRPAWGGASTSLSTNGILRTARTKFRAVPSSTFRARVARRNRPPRSHWAKFSVRPERSRRALSARTAPHDERCLPIDEVRRSHYMPQYPWNGCCSFLRSSLR